MALGPDGRPDFNMLQNFRSAEANITYYAFDILVHKNRDLTMLPLSERREILRSVVKPAKHVALSEVSNQTASEMLKFVRSHGLEGIIAKRSDTVYQPGQRTGAWSKHRINLGQEFVIGGFPARMASTLSSSASIKERIFIMPPGYVLASFLQPGAWSSNKSRG